MFALLNGLLRCVKEEMKYFVEKRQRTTRDQLVVNARDGQLSINVAAKPNE